MLKYVAGWDVERRDDFDADHNGKIEIYDAIPILNTIANRCPDWLGTEEVQDTSCTSFYSEPTVISRFISWACF